MLLMLTAFSGYDATQEGLRFYPGVCDRVHYMHGRDDVKVNYSLTLSPKVNVSRTRNKKIVVRLKMNSPPA